MTRRRQSHAARRSARVREDVSRPATPNRTAQGGRFVAVFLLCAGLYLSTTHDRVFSAGNDASRFAQIESLVDYHMKTIEQSRYAMTVDRVVVGGHAYSNKPPLLSLVGAGAYAALQRLTGWRIGITSPTRGSALRALTFLLVGLSAAWLVASFDRELTRFATLSPRWRAALTIVLACGTLLTSFAATLNNHIPAAALIFASFGYVLAQRPLAAGLACGLAAAVDLLPGLGLAPFLAVAGAGSLRNWRVIGRFATGVLPGILAAAAANLYITGTALPPKFLPGAIDISSPLRLSVLNIVRPESPYYAVEILFGGHGLLSTTPVLIIGIWGFALARRRPPFGTAWLWRWLAAGIVTQFVGHAFVAGVYGGWSYGFRYLLPVEPLVLFLAPTALAGRSARALFLAATPPSILFAALGAYHPWPPAYEQTAERDPIASMVTVPPGAIAAAWCAIHFPDAPACDWLGARFIAADRTLRNRYLLVFFGSKGDLDSARRFQ